MGQTKMPNLAFKLDKIRAENAKFLIKSTPTKKVTKKNYDSYIIMHTKLKRIKLKKLW
jgi:hypothetical protein